MPTFDVHLPQSDSTETTLDAHPRRPPRSSRERVNPLPRNASRQISSHSAQSRKVGIKTPRILTGYSGVHVGADTALGPDLLAGVAFSWTEADLDTVYTGVRRSDDDTPVKGAYESRMRSVHPYASRSSAPGSQLWATPGYGDGAVEIADEEAQANGLGRQTGDLAMKTAAADGSLRLTERGEASGAFALDLKGEGWLTRLELDGNGALLAPVTADASRLRLAVDASHESRLADGALFRPSAELGLRHDGGDGETGFGVELRGGTEPRAALRIDGELGYGLDAGGGLLTPYGGFGLSGDSQRQRLGLRFSPDDGLGMDLEGYRKESREADHGVMPGLVPGISLNRFRRAAWIPGTSPGMTVEAFGHDGGGRIEERTPRRPPRYAAGAATRDEGERARAMRDERAPEARSGEAVSNSLSRSGEWARWRRG